MNPLTADAALQRAQTFSAGGDYRTAVRYLYLSTLLLLEERGLFRYDRSLTNREYLRRVAHDPTLSAILQDVVEVFDRVHVRRHRATVDVAGKSVDPSARSSYNYTPLPHEVRARRSGPCRTGAQNN